VFEVKENMDFGLIVQKLKNFHEEETFEAEIGSILGKNYLTAIETKKFESNQRTVVTVDGVFISIGGVPIMNLVKAAGIYIDGKGCIEVDRRQLQISKEYPQLETAYGGMQIITAAGEEVVAVIQAYRYIRTL